ncbi:MAG: L,D-transpeptidase [Mesorhizobium sp.]
MSDHQARSIRMNRRAFLGAATIGAGGVLLAGGSARAFAQEQKAPTLWSGQSAPAVTLDPPSVMYAARVDDGHSLPAIPYEKLDKRLRRQVVIDPTNEAPGTIVVDTSQHYLFLVMPGGRAIRYGVSLGKAGFDWTGSAVVQYKKAWPIWTPPPEMIKRKPELAKYANGMPPGPQSPLGARALYLFKNGRDTMYRLHGTPEWNSIGKNASSGCVRMLNQDVMDLFARVSGKATVHVRHSMYLGASGGAAPKPGKETTEAIDSGVPEGAEALQ